MTFPDDRARRQRGARPLPSLGQIFFCLMTTFCFLLVLRNADAAVEYMGRGLTLCARTVIPSLFPFMVLSELLVSSGAGEALGRIFARPMRWLFGLSGAGASAVFLGSMCGSPVGARTAVALYDKNAISRAECEHLLTFSNNPSSAFLITAVGASLFGNRRLGMILYLTVLGSSFLIGFLLRFFFRQDHEDGRHRHPHFPSGLHVGGVSTFTGAVSNAAMSMLTVCAYVIFFSAITGTLFCFIEEVGSIPPGLAAASYGFFEMSGGISEAVALSNNETAVVLTAAIAGWSGLSVHCQIMALCGGRGLSFKPYLIAKALQGILCAAVMIVVLRVSDPAQLIPETDTVVDTLFTIGTSWKDIQVPCIVTNTLFIVGWLTVVWRRWRHHNE